MDPPEPDENLDLTIGLVRDLVAKSNVTSTEKNLYSMEQTIDLALRIQN